MSIEWRTRTETVEELWKDLLCPFEIPPLKMQDHVPADYTMGLWFLVTKQENTPWTGYYTNYKGAKMALLNSHRVWFKVKQCGTMWEAVRVAQCSLGLTHIPLDGINIKKLWASGLQHDSAAPTPMPSCATSCTLSEIKDKGKGQDKMNNWQGPVSLTVYHLTCPEDKGTGDNSPVGQEMTPLPWRTLATMTNDHTNEVNN
jgi:hypothetical protein